MLSLASLLRESARRYPDKTAVKLGDKELSYQQLDAVSNQIADFLIQSGIKIGDKVAISCPNLPYFPMVYYGILKAGAAVIPLNILLKPREIAYHLKDSDAKVFFAFEGSEELPLGKMAAEGFAEVEGCETLVIMTKDPQAPSPIEGTSSLGQILAKYNPTCDMIITQETDTAVVLYTSGTTGHPKGAELSQLNMVLNAMVTKEIFESLGRVLPEHKLLLVLPIFHSFGQTVCMNTVFLGGGQIILSPRFDPKQTLEAFLNYKITAFAGVPTMYWALLKEAQNLPLEKLAPIRENLCFCASGGAALPVELLRNFEKVFGVEILEGYGLSETSPLASFNHMHRPRKVGSIGQPIWGVEMKIVGEDGQTLPPEESGEIAIRGHNVMKGYYKRPQANEEAIRDGWFYTGDVGKMDKEGYFFIVDRVKDMVIRGGFNVYPREVEEVLMTHPAISLAAVIGLSHEEYGEEIKAYVILKDGVSATPEELIAWSKENLASYKYPRMIEIREELPMGPTGKILKRELKQQESS